MGLTDIFIMHTMYFEYSYHLSHIAVCCLASLIPFIFPNDGPFLFSVLTILKLSNYNVFTKENKQMSLRSKKQGAEGEISTQHIKDS